MKLYFAPLEGITTYTYRNVHYRLFGGCDSYFSPFITPTDNERLTIRNLRGIMPEQNEAPLRVQCLTESGAAFIRFSRRVKELGYDEVNLNLGCPSGTVVSKGRGAGALRDIAALERLLSRIGEQAACRISVKTRIGYEDRAEFPELLSLFEKLPLQELIVHPRTREAQYGGRPDMEAFDLAYESYGGELCYNGDVTSVLAFEEIQRRYPDLSGVMIGRGAVKNPALFREIHGGKQLQTEELIHFSQKLEEAYIPIMNSEVNTLHKLKEVWSWMLLNFPEEKKILKAVKKSKNLRELNHAVSFLPNL